MVQKQHEVFQQPDRLDKRITLISDMKTKLKVFTSTIASLVGLLFVECTADINAPSRVEVDRNINVTIYATHENGDTVETVLPGSHGGDRPHLRTGSVLSSHRFSVKS